MLPLSQLHPAGHRGDGRSGQGGHNARRRCVVPRRLSHAAGRVFLVLILAATMPTRLLAWYDPVLDYGVVPGHPGILWLQDHGEVTGCCHVEGGVSSRYTAKLGVKARFDAVMSQRDFLYVFPSGYTVPVVASPSGGAANYMTICDSDISGVAHRVVDYRFCSPRDTMRGIVGMKNMDYWLQTSDTLNREVLLHELGHRWGAQCYTSTPGVNIGFSHWWWGGTQGVDYFDIPSLMANYTTSKTSFDPLDLYLMGLGAPQEVPNHDYVDPLGQRTPVTIQSIIDATGVRDPAYPSAPHDFSVAFVVITPEGVEPIGAELDKIESWRASLPGWWNIATSGRSALSIDIAPSVAGAVPDGNGVPGTPLTIRQDGSGQLVLTWGASCAARDVDYAVYEGTLGSCYSHAPRLCSTGGATTVTLSTDGMSHYYLVVPRSSLVEGSYGVASNGAERPQGSPSCAPQATAPGCTP